MFVQIKDRINLLLYNYLKICIFYCYTLSLFKNFFYKTRIGVLIKLLLFAETS